MAEGTVYECANPDCTLGSRYDPGRFTGGISAELASDLTGTPVDDVTDYGEGYCPNCGVEGTEVSDG
jgi:hypothetical protein